MKTVDEEERMRKTTFNNCFRTFSLKLLGNFLTCIIIVDRHFSDKLLRRGEWSFIDRTFSRILKLGWGLQLTNSLITDDKYKSNLPEIMRNQIDKDRKQIRFLNDLVNIMFGQNKRQRQEGIKLHCIIIAGNFDQGGQVFPWQFPGVACYKRLDTWTLINEF